VSFCIPKPRSARELEPKPEPESLLRSSSQNRQGLVQKESSRRSVVKRPHAYWPRYDEDHRHYRSWKDLVTILCKAG
jgi:hypothetical protein